jgi:hypothetical protein
MKAFLFLAFLPWMAAAQVPNRTHTDCSGQTRDVYSTLASGKVLLVASKGHDCSICINSAPALGTFASQHSAHIAVWGAQTLTYSSANPTCTQVNNWVNAYNWQSVFAFVDANREWYIGGTPYYYVIDPRDSTQAYAGTNRTTAQNTALAIVNALGINDVRASAIGIRANANTLFLSNYPANTTLEAYDLSGKKVLNTTPGQDAIAWSVAPGWYVVYINSPEGEQRVKIQVLP